MPDRAINKVIYGNRTLIDLTSDTVSADKVLDGYQFHAADGTIQNGTCVYDVDSSSVTANVDDVISGKTFAKNGSILTGTMPNIGTQTSTLTSVSQPVTISQGYHDGSGSVGLSSADQNAIIAGNIKSGVSILGVTGTYDGNESIHSVACNVTPSVTAQTIQPGNIPPVGTYNYFTQVNVDPIPYTEVPNAAGGLTVTIAAA